MAYELQIPDDFEQALHIAVTGVPKAIDALRINDGHLSLHLADVGLNAAVIERFEQENVRGLWGYVRQYMRVLFRVRPIRFRLQVDGRLIRRYAYMAVIANATSYGTGAKINPGGKIDDGRFELILLRPYSLWHLLQLIIASFLGRLTDLESVEAYSCRKLEIENSRKHVVQVDGEIIGQLQEIRVEILPQALRVITAN
jgi:diacylglycerol kinase family enzyme